MSINRNRVKNVQFRTLLTIFKITGCEAKTCVVLALYHYLVLAVCEGSEKLSKFDIELFEHGE